MKTKLYFIKLIIINLLLLCGAASAQVLNVGLNVQEQDQWCWAACSKTILNYYGKQVSQCQIADYTRTVSNWHSYGTVPCCSDASQGCNYWNYNWGAPGSIEDILSHWGIQDATLGRTLSLQEITTEINNGHPFVVRWGWYSGGGHFVVGHGVSGNTVYYMNPWPGEGLKFADYNWLVDDGNHQWTHTNTMVTNPTTQTIQVNLTTPANNAVYNAPATITLAANATVSSGSISKVEFYNGTTLISTDNTSPYSYTWGNISAGSYAVTAKAYDNLNQSVTSTVVNFTVQPPANKIPIVYITSPANNSSFNSPATITFTANASDSDGIVSKVYYYNGNTFIGSATSSPYSFTWNNVNAGTYSISAKAVDNIGDMSNPSTINVIVNNVVTQSPYGGTSWLIPGTIQAENYDIGGEGIAYHDADISNQGNAYRSEGVDIEGTTDVDGGFNVGWTAAGEYLEYTVNVTASGLYDFSMRVASTMAGKSFHVEMDGQNITGAISVPNTGAWQNWQTVIVKNISLTQGQKIMRVVMDTDGFNLNYVSVSATKINSNPVVNIVSPSNNTSFTVPASITINANASDSDGTISKVDFYNGSILLGSDNSSPYSFVWNNVAAGTYSLTAKATDNANATTTSSSVTIVVNAAQNSAPSVNIASPVNNTSFTAPASITINANASDIDGTVTNVEFYNGSVLLGSDNTSPYTFVWNNVAAGTYSLSAKAKDNVGSVTTSAVISIAVNNVTSNLCSSIPQYVENNGYVAANKVQNAGGIYQCKPYPYSGWCNGSAWAYAPGTGAYWTDAWDKVGSCSAKTGAVDASEIKAINLFPNPTKESSLLRLNVSDVYSGEVIVFNQFGEQVLTTKLESNLEVSIDLKGMKSGMYTIKVISGNNVWVEKLIKQ